MMVSFPVLPPLSVAACMPAAEGVTPLVHAEGVAGEAEAGAVSFALVTKLFRFLLGSLSQETCARQ